MPKNLAQTVPQTLIVGGGKLKGQIRGRMAQCNNFIQDLTSSNSVWVFTSCPEGELSRNQERPGAPNTRMPSSWAGSPDPLHTGESWSTTFACPLQSRTDKRFHSEGDSSHVSCPCGSECGRGHHKFSSRPTCTAHAGSGLDAMHTSSSQANNNPFAPQPHHCAPCHGCWDQRGHTFRVRFSAKGPARDLDLAPLVGWRCSLAV